MIFSRLTAADVCLLTTTGRRTGRPHTIEIWFAIEAGRLYVLSGSARSDWLLNVRRDPAVRVRINTRTAPLRARLVDAGTPEGALARRLLAAKYQGWRSGERLSAWARTALPVAIDLD